MKRPPPKAVSAYFKAIQIADEDSVHEVIAREGPKILEMGLPYVLLAARWRLSSSIRKAVRQHELLERSEVPSTPPLSVWDPYERAVRNEQLQILLQAIASLHRDGRLSLEDLKIVWAHASGYTDRQIQAEWVGWGLPSPVPTQVALRKRRQRALGQIRRVVHENLSQHEVPKKDGVI